MEMKSEKLYVDHLYTRKVEIEKGEMECEKGILRK